MESNLSISFENLEKIAFFSQTEAEKERAVFKLESASLRAKTLSGLFL
ncbi:MAG: hypothetical protein JRD49_10640, partial [Deltaproteobacteria bacterium]|nr:hypothetical protein [Deltaproteobacteria bacterium]